MRFTSTLLIAALISSTLSSMCLASTPNPQSDAQRDLESYSQGQSSNVDRERLSQLRERNHVLDASQVSRLVENGAVPADVLNVVSDLAKEIGTTDPTLSEVRETIARSGRLQVADIGMAAALVPAFWAGAVALTASSCYLVLNMDKKPVAQKCKP